MTKNKMKDRIIEELQKAKEAGQITTEKVSEIVRKAVSASVAETRGSIDKLRPIVKDAVSAAVEGLKGGCGRRDCRCLQPWGSSG
jgi:hypothetical protein